MIFFIKYWFIGVVGPNMGNAAMWIIMAGMLIARLEIYVFIFSFFRIVDDVKDLFKRGNLK